VERPTVVMPDAVKPELSPEDKVQLDVLLKELEDLIREKSGAGENSV
jgi:hypothetical protein